MWNEHLQEVIDELVTILCEMPPTKCAWVITLVQQKLASKHINTETQCTLTNPIHEWLLPPGDPQWVPYVPPPEQRVEQRCLTPHSYKSWPSMFQHLQELLTHPLSWQCPTQQLNAR
jgi:hypothetical protein